MSDALAIFNSHRPYLLGVAYRMLGSIMDAEDIVQEAYLRWDRVDHDGVQSAKAYLTSIVTRLSIDQLRSARVKREVYVGQWLPEPWLTTADHASTEAQAPRDLQLAESLSTAFLVLLESLTPTERAAFLLREVFDYDYRDVAETLDKTEANCRQLVKRSRDKLGQSRHDRREPRHEVRSEDEERLTLQFFEAVKGGDLAALVDTLSHDAALYSDHGGKATAAKRTITTADKIARFLIGITTRFAPEEAKARIQSINGRPGIVIYSRGTAITVYTFEIRDGKIQAVYSLRNPEKLGHLESP